MKLYFLRHGTATETATTDAVRPLTREGKREARAAGLALTRLGIKPEAILTSPLLRARQTAQAAARALGLPRRVSVLESLKNGVGTPRLRQTLRPYANLNHLLLVGHLPSLPKHIAGFTGLSRAEALRLGKGSLACVEIETLDSNTGTLRWLIGKKVLRLLSRSGR